LGKTAFTEWVKIYKCLVNIDPALLDVVRHMSQEHLGKALSKVAENTTCLSSSNIFFLINLLT
jgi:hypothetical protein